MGRHVCYSHLYAYCHVNLTNPKPHVSSLQSSCIVWQCIKISRWREIDTHSDSPSTRDQQDLTLWEMKISIKNGQETMTNQLHSESVNVRAMSQNGLSWCTITRNNKHTKGVVNLNLETEIADINMLLTIIKKSYFSFILNLYGKSVYKPVTWIIDLWRRTWLLVDFLSKPLFRDITTWSFQRDVRW